MNSQPNGVQITVCICTYKRPRLLQRLLLELGRQATDGQFTYSIVVADNDSDRSAEPVVSAARAALPVEIQYCVEPRRNIALARNKALEHATGELIACLDDDEFPTTHWLLTLFTALHGHQADGVLGPVKPFYEKTPPSWIIRGKIHERPAHKTGTRLHWRQARTGNVLFRKRILKDVQEPFRAQFGIGGEDQDFFERMMEAGHSFIWCDEAVAYEVVPPERWTRAYVLKRALLRGQNECHHRPDPIGIVKSLIAAPLYALSLPVLLLASHHLFMRNLIRLCDHSGKILALVGFRPAGRTYVSH
jgi:succinoglycan biosynthesis protein ExoM